MPIVIRAKSKRLTNDQHRVEITAVDVPVEKTLSLATDDDQPEASPPGAPNTIAYDVYVAWESKDVEDSGYSRKPDQVLEDCPQPGTRCIVWRGFPLGEKHNFLLKRGKSGAYTVEINAEAHIRIVAGGATETVTFPPTP